MQNGANNTGDEMARYQSAAAGLCYTSDLSPTNSSNSLIDQTDIFKYFPLSAR